MTSKGPFQPKLLYDSSFNYFKHGLKFMTQDKLILEGLFYNPTSSTNSLRIIPFELVVGKNMLNCSPIEISQLNSKSNFMVIKHFLIHFKKTITGPSILVLASLWVMTLSYSAYI